MLKAEGWIKGLFVSTFLSLCVPRLWASPSDIECQSDQRNFRCVEFVRNYDGDTITVNIKGVPELFGKNIPVRVKGIDTAEIKTLDRCERQASRTARRLVFNTLKSARRIDLLNVERDKYFRILADVMVDGRSISEILIKNKLAVAYKGGKKPNTNWCTMIGEQADSNPLD